MAGFKLGDIFNNVVSKAKSSFGQGNPSLTIDFNKYPDLKTFIDSKVGTTIGRSIYKDLQQLSKQSNENLNFIESCLKGQSAVKHVDKPRNGYQNISNLVFELVQEYKTGKKRPYNQFYTLMVGLHKPYLKGRKSSDPDDNTAYLDNVTELEETRLLKDFKINYGKGDTSIELTNPMFHSLLNIRDKSIKKYVDAINTDNTSLPVDMTSDIGKIYLFFKTLNTRCADAAKNMSILKSKLGSKDKQTKEMFISDYKPVDVIPVKSLSDRHTHVEFIYKLYDMQNNEIEGGAIYGGNFKFYDLKNNYNFVNVDNKNISFQFQKGDVPVEGIVTEDVTTFSVIFNSQSFDKAKLQIGFVSFKIAQMVDNRDAGSYQVCDMLDEFVEIYNSYMDMRDVKLKNSK